MATDTLHYHLKKPASADRVAIGDINDNSDTIDGYLYQANERADQLADDYNTSSTYNTGDYVRRDNYIYKCNTDDTTGTWDDTKWDRVKITEELGNGGGGSSTLAGLNDVSLATPTNGQLLGYNGTSHKWENVNGGGGGSSTLAGLSDVSVSGVADKDIIRYNSITQKYEKSSDLTDLELSVSQLSSSVLNIAGDVDTLELKVNQMSASTLPYDSNTSTKQKIDNVESSIPTSASNLPYSSTQSTKQKIDEVNGKVIIGTPTAGESYTTLYRGQYVRIGNLVMVSAVIGVNTNLTANYRILNDLPTVADVNSNVGFANPQHTESNTNPITIRMYDKGLYTNKANELVANKVYYLSAMYITSDN